MDNNINIGSKEIARAAIAISMSNTRQEEQLLKSQFKLDGINTVAVDYGGEFLTSIVKIVDRAVLAAKREGLIKDSHIEHGAVAGASREALSQISTKALGLNVGGKIGIARHGDHLAVAVFFEIGLGNLNEICIGMGHRAL